MKQKIRTRLERATAIVYFAVAAMFVGVLLYVGLFENVSVYSARDFRTVTSVDEYVVREIEDPQAPAGVRKEYRWTLDNIGTNENSLCFYLVHQYAQVYFDDQLMYSLMPGEENIICRGVSSNWVMLPVYPEDSGKEVRVVMTPAYENAVGFQVEFFLGSRFSIAFMQLRHDALPMVLAAMCIFVGLIIMAVQLVLIMKKKVQKWDMVWLGNFSIILGIWKITDMRFAPIMFNGNSLVLGYITIGALFLGAIPMLFYEKSRLSDRDSLPITAEILAFCAAACAVLLYQVFGVAEFKQTLVVSHIMIMVAVVSSVLVLFVKRRRSAVVRKKENALFFILLILGALFDIVVFYVVKSSSDLMFSMLAFLISIIIAFVKNILEIDKRARTDAQTGFFNRSRWNQLMNEEPAGTESIGIIMLDLNRLKHVNDTMGHEAGDKMILNFSNILRNSISPSNTICRWGGDEFTVMITDATQEKVEACLKEIERAVTQYNKSGEKPAIYYAAGYALTEQFPGLTRKELTQKADERMYQDKKHWYKENLNTVYHSPV